MTPNSLDKISLFQGDITTLDVDVIVNAANTSLLGGGGVDGAIHRAAGPDLLAECQTLNGCLTGEAKLTRGYNLPARYVIHTVGPVYQGRLSDRHLLQSCYDKSFCLAIDTHLESIAFPAISCGVYGYPIAEAATIAINTTIHYINNSEQLKRVTFVLFSREDFDIYLKILNNRAGKGSTHLQ